MRRARSHCLLGFLLFLAAWGPRAQGPVLVPAAASVPGGEPGRGLGSVVASAGDVNGDSFDDLIATSPASDGSTRVLLLQGGATGFSLQSSIEVLFIGGALPGLPVVAAGAGDVDGDGFEDVIIGDPSHDGERGRVSLFFGAASGLVLGSPVTVEGDAAGERLGASVAAAGNVNASPADRRADIAVGSALEARVYLGRPTASRSAVFDAPAWSHAREEGFPGFARVAGPIDVDGDGVDDVVVGDPDYEDNRAGEGAIHVYSGSPEGIELSRQEIEGEEVDAHLGHSLAPAGDVDGNGREDLLCVREAAGGSQVALYLGSLTGLRPQAGWSVSLGARLPWSPQIASSAGDLNADGFGDVVLAFPVPSGGSLLGHARVHLGSADGLSLKPAWTSEATLERPAAPESPYTLSALGSPLAPAVGLAGDVDRDGFSDLLIGAPSFRNTGGALVGRVILYRGASLALSLEPNWTFESNFERGRRTMTRSAGDVNADGFGDVLVGAPRGGDNGGFGGKGRVLLYLGGAAGLSDSPAWVADGEELGEQFGFSLTTASDVDGDGKSDVLVGAPGYDFEGNENLPRGRVFLYLTGHSADILPRSASWIEAGHRTRGQFGISTASAGDVNDDGYPDIVIGESMKNLPEEGRAYVYLGNGSGFSGPPIVLAAEEVAVDWFGDTVAGAGDVNGDGYDDVLVAALYVGDDDRGAAYLFYGGPDGPDPGRFWKVEGIETDEYLGSDVADAGDVNGDGYADILLGSKKFGDSQGRIQVFHGSADDPVFSKSFVGKSGSDLFTVASAGDVNRDGFADVILGAPWWWPTPASIRVGRAFLHIGGPEGISTAPVWTFDGPHDDAELGGEIAGAGDVNGDGHDDVIVDSAGYTNGEPQEGAAFVFHGNGGPSRRTADAPFLVSVSVKVLRDADGNDPATGYYATRPQIISAMRETNDVLSRSGAAWSLHLSEIVYLSGVDSFYDIGSLTEVRLLETEARAAPGPFAWRSDAINIYVVNTFEKGGTCSFPDEGEVIVINNSAGILNGSVGWLHEVGHYLSLTHTFRNAMTPTCDSSLGAVHSGLREAACGDICPDTDNVMSYNELTPAHARFSRCQVDEMLFELLDPSGSRGRVVVRTVTPPDIEPQLPPGDLVPFKRGDANSDGVLNLTDVILTLEVLFQDGEFPTCGDAVDTNDDGEIDISDPISGLFHLFLAASTIPAPGPDICSGDGQIGGFSDGLTTCIYAAPCPTSGLID